MHEGTQSSFEFCADCLFSLPLKSFFEHSDISLEHNPFWIPIDFSESPAFARSDFAKIPKTGASSYQKTAIKVDFAAKMMERGSLKKRYQCENLDYLPFVHSFTPTPSNKKQRLLFSEEDVCSLSDQTVWEDETFEELCNKFAPQTQGVSNVSLQVLLEEVSFEELCKKFETA